MSLIKQSAQLTALATQQAPEKTASDPNTSLDEEDKGISLCPQKMQSSLSFMVMLLCSMYVVKI